MTDLSAPLADVVGTKTAALLKSEFESKSAINALKKIEKACVEVGFYQVTGHGISIKKIENICKITQDFV